MDGIEVARRLLQQPKVPLVVFITAYDEYAVSAFETHAIDYLLKPLSSSRLASCCENCSNNCGVTWLQAMIWHS